MKGNSSGNLRKKMIIVTIFFVAIPILVSGFITKTIAERALLEEKEKKLFGITSMLDQYLQHDFEAILQKEGTLSADEETKISVLNESLREFTDVLAKANPGIGVGYYVRGLDAIVTYGPSEEYGDIVGKDIEEEHPGREVMSTGEKQVEIGKQVRGQIMNAMLPLIRDGKVIGYVWANELTRDVESQLYKMDRIIFLCFGLGVLAVILLLVNFWNSLLVDINAVKQGLQQMKFDLKRRITVRGEIGEIADAVNGMAASILHARTLNENVMDSMVDGIITVNTEGNITFMNKAAMHLTGVQLEEVINRPYTKSMIHGVEFSSLLMETLQTGKTYIGIEMNYPANGKNLYISSSTSRLQDSDGKFIGAIVTFKDISEKKRLEQQVYRADRLAALGEMMAAVAHEIRNPLTAIKSLVQYLQEGSTEEERQEFHPLIIKEVDRANKIIHELLYFSRSADANFLKVNVNDLIRQTIVLVKNVSKHKTSFNLDLQDWIPEAEIDPEQFKQVFLNILINSAQAMDGPGEITVETDYDSIKGKISIVFSDTGPGIEEEQISKVFDPFYTTKKEGTGIGLAVVQRIISAHNGEIFMENIPSGGLKATIIIPINYSIRGEKNEKQ
ncbi:hypothetical protein AM500_01250 [Bacillus sp. FJAT-18017]|uniref:two-component system sensor histidine kinase AtoS n=1 Tax=Bacillus sp. FJAT-18017 TaxID=1705566 RepID=UPI0006AF2158|nr:two-component system sensor histidine kinase AtoS [Bacillus sp. FJAT-18017]ALC88570.1 hypothetical protein AM500_01250 [Bacillus sp. FJAT-18017]